MKRRARFETGRSARAGAALSLSKAALLTAAFAVLMPAALTAVRAAPSEPNALRFDDGTLLGAVDSATVSVLTVISTPPPPVHTVPGTKQRRLIGTGVVLSRHRVVTTASMAIRGGVFHAVLNDGGERVAHLRGVDPQSNVALFEVEGASLQELRRTAPQSLAVGSWVAVIANVGIARPQITLGRVIGRGERVDYPYSGEVIEVDAPAYPGSAGGAVLNEEGEWVAVVVGRAATTATGGSVGPGATDPTTSTLSHESQGLFVALPVDHLDRIAQDLEKYGAVRRGFLGIRLRRDRNLADSVGITVHGVVSGSPAEKAGIRPGDRILAIDGEYVHTSDEVTEHIRAMGPGEDVELTIARGSEIRPIRISLGSALPADALGARDDTEIESLRLRLQALEAETRAVRERIRILEMPPRR
jgi:S1-C subfamily serine protease